MFDFGFKRNCHFERGTREKSFAGAMFCLLLVLLHIAYRRFLPPVEMTVGGGTGALLSINEIMKIN
jgi:hypothetical protein